MDCSPIIIFAFNRLEKIQTCISSLTKNSEACESDLIVFVDGPRKNKENDEIKVQQVRNFVKSISGFKSISYHFSDINKGLSASIIDGVSQIIEQYGKAIIVEDDLVCSLNFLSFMNQGLDEYIDTKEVFSICGYSHRVKTKIDYKYDSYFAPRSNSWGWATWKDRWDTVDWKLEDWPKIQTNKKAFNKWGGSDCYSLLNGWKKGKNNSWAIRFVYAQFIQHKTSLFPVVSKISNDGFGSDATHCTEDGNRFKYDFDFSNNKTFRYPPTTIEQRYFVKQRKWPNSLYMRFCSRLNRLLHL